MPPKVRQVLERMNVLLTAPHATVPLDMLLDGLEEVSTSPRVLDVLRLPLTSVPRLLVPVCRETTLLPLLAANLWFLFRVPPVTVPMWVTALRSLRPTSTPELFLATSRALTLVVYVAKLGKPLMLVGLFLSRWLGLLVRLLAALRDCLLPTILWTTPWSLLWLSRTEKGFGLPGLEFLPELALRRFALVGGLLSPASISCALGPVFPR